MARKSLGTHRKGEMELESGEFVHERTLLDVKLDVALCALQACPSYRSMRVCVERTPGAGIALTFAVDSAVWSIYGTTHESR